MSLWRQLTYGLRSLTHRSARDRDVADEVEQYFEEAEAAWRSRGLSPENARRAARLDAGDMFGFEVIAAVTATRMIPKRT